MINTKKEYKTRSGNQVRILCTDRPGNYPVVALVYYHDGDTSIGAFTMEGRFYNHNECSGFDLIEICPWADFKEDDPVMVRDEGDDEWIKHHFSHVKDGKPHTFMGGCTSFTSESGTIPWSECKRPNDD